MTCRLFTRRTFVRTAAAAAAAALALGLSGCGQEEAPADGVKKTHVRIGVVDNYNDQWDYLKPVLAKDNIEIELVKYGDYAAPNRALNDKEIELNAFQHKAFLANDIKQNGYKLAAIGDTFIAPLRIYNNKKKIQSVANFKDGDKVGIPSDLTNGGRALKLLEAAGLIKVDPAKGFIPTKADITEYVKKIEIVEAESGMLANLLPDFAACIINGGNAFTAGFGPADAIFSEKFDEDQPYLQNLVNVIVAREEDKDNPIYKRIVEVYQTPEVAKVINEAYKGGYVPAWKQQ